MPIAPSSAEAKAQVEQLVERFDRNLETYKRPEYKETQVRVEFIDPLFEALGWDVRNVQGYAELYKDVVHEDAIKVSDAADVVRHDRMVALVERMLDLHKKLAAATIPADKVLYQRQAEATDRQIDALVYELYGLTDEETAIVEG
jgi:hypothetical protein